MVGNRNYVLLVLKGFAMGIADVVPGVSGGTIAFITGIYEQLLNSIKSVNLTAIKLFFSFRFKEFWKHINGNFLLAVVGGIAIAVFSLAKLMTILLAEYPIFIWSFFFGLIVASSLLVAKEVAKWNFTTILSFLIGIAVAYLITTATPAQTPNDWWYIIISGAVAICAMILPGISGSFILLLMGKYIYIMEAISSFNISVIALFGVGALMGITSFSHVLSWLLKKFHSIMVALLTGFMIGSLNKVWAWKEIVSTYVDSDGVVQPLLEKNVLPSTFETITASPAFVVEAVIMSIVGFGLIYGIELIAKKLKNN